MDNGRGTAGRERPAWLRWLMLAVALGLCWSIWDEVGTYTTLAQHAVFSPGELEDMAAAYRFRWAIRGLLVVLFVYQAVVWTRDEKSRRTQLQDGIAFSVLALAWLSLALFLSMDGIALLLWLAVLLGLVVCAGWSWWKFGKTKPKNM